MFTYKNDLVVDRCREITEKYLNIPLVWNPTPTKNPNAIAGSFDWNDAHGIDPVKWTSIIVDEPKMFPTIRLFVLTVCYEIEKVLLHKRIENPQNEDDQYLRAACDYARGLVIWSNAIKLAKKEFDLELDMYCASHVNSLIIGGSCGENNFLWNQRK